MFEILQKISTWGELIGITIPLLYILSHKPKDATNRPLVLYIITAFILNLLIIIIAKNNGYYSFIPKSNHIYYNIHSIAKVIFFGWYLYLFKSLKSSSLIRVLVWLFLIFALINFSFFQPLHLFSERVANIESILLLIFCSAFFISTIIDNSETIWMNKPVFIVCASINLYAALNFFVFLFFNYLNVEEKQKNYLFSILLIVFSFSYMILCITLTFALKKSTKKEASIYSGTLPAHEPIQ